MEESLGQLVVPMTLRTRCCSNELWGEARRETSTGSFRAYCRVCGTKQSYYFSHDEVLGTKSGRRGSRFAVSEQRRSEILMRDGYRCVHCGTAAPRESSVTKFVEDIIDSHLGPQWRSGDPTLGNESIDPCGRCGQFLPGFARTVPREVLLRLPDDKMQTLLDLLEKAALEVDHGIPVTILKNQRFAMKAEEERFCTKIFLVTACGRCNRGLGKILEPYAFMESLLLKVVFRSDVVEFKRHEGMLKALYLKARAVDRSIASRGAI